MIGLIAYDSILEYGISEVVLKNAIYRYRKGKSKSWENEKDLIDKRKVWINLDSIPAQTRAKYNLPTGKEYIRQQREELAEKERKLLAQLEKAQEEKAQLEQLETEARQERERSEAERENAQILSCLNKAYYEAYSKFLLKYKAKGYGLEKRKKLAQMHSLYDAMIELCGREWPIRGMAKKVFAAYHLLPSTITKVKAYETFVSKLKKARTKGIEEVVIHKGTGTTNRKFVNEFHYALIVIYASQKNKYSTRVIKEIVNIECKKYGYKTISESTVKQYLAKPEIKNMVSLYRDGTKTFENNVLPHLPRQQEMFAGNLWAMDGTPAQFLCWNEKKGKQRKRVRLNLYVVIDAFSLKVVGFDISVSEDRFNVLNSLKMAADRQGHLPSEILHDNFSANKTDEIKELKSKMESLGVSFRASKPGNPKDKTQVERFFGTLQSKIMRLYDDFLGEGITSKRENGRPDAEFVRKSIKRTNLTTKELKYRLAYIIGQYNVFQSKEKDSPVLRYRKSPKPHIKTLKEHETAFIFWYKKTIKITRSMVGFTVRGQKHFYQIFDNQTKLELNSQSVDVRYDEKDLDLIYLFKKDTDSFICTCKHVKAVTASEVGRDEEANQELYKHGEHIKSFKKDIKNNKSNIINKGLIRAGLEEYTAIDALSMDKHKINDEETLETINHFCIENNIDDTDMDIMKSQRKRKTYRLDEFDEDALLECKITTKPPEIVKKTNRHD